MKTIIRSLVFAMSCVVAIPCYADAKEVQETLDVVWEGFWQQQGYLQRVSKWQEPIRVRFSGASLNPNRVFALTQLKRVASVAGIEVSETDSAGAANMDVEFLHDNPVSRTDPCVTFRRPAFGVITHVRIKIPERSMRRCVLHEFMHAMGVSGHPNASSILSYFRTSQELTTTDEFILKVLYSDDIKPGMYPLPTLQVFARRLIETAPPGEAKAEAERVTAQFMREAIKQMEAFAQPKGEPPRVLLRSGKVTPAGLVRGRTDVQFLLGLAYTFGHGIEVDKKKGFEFLSSAASYSHSGALFYVGEAYRLGRGIEQDRVEAYKWYLLAAAKGSPRAKSEVEKLELALSPSDAEAGKARAAGWKPSSNEAATTEADR